MTLAAGSQLGPYTIETLLGAGGMGEVYRARDTRLERTVAIKVLPERLSRDVRLRERLEREAKAVSSLQHPHICTLFDIGLEGEGETAFLVMEHVEGESLSDRLKRGRLQRLDASRVASARDACSSPGERPPEIVRRSNAPDRQRPRSRVSVVQVDRFARRPYNGARTLEPIVIGQTLAHYRVLEKLGSGGMGDVYRAHDTELDREVALKVLPLDLAGSEERRARFKREAKAIAALNHPNIVQVFSVEEDQGVHFITMELVRGKGLSELLPRGGLAIKRFLELAIPLADAVAAAHDAGITHRDLKPDNVMVSNEGRVKVLDFGLAKAQGGFEIENDESEVPTQAKTEEGAILGTVHYMSPEQAQGKPADHRSDVFALGVLFYQMLAGRRPFDADSPVSTLHTIIKEDPPPVTGAGASIPRELRWMVERCLAKDPARRYQSTHDLQNELVEMRERLASGELSVSGSQAKPSGGRRVLWPLAGVLSGALFSALIITTWTGGRRALPTLENVTRVTSAVGVEDQPAWSPDGRMLAYAATTSGDWLGGNWDIWVQPLGGGDAINRTADYDGEDRHPSWSPDGSQIAFWSSRDGGGYFIMPSLSGSPRNATVLTPLSNSGSLGAPPQWSHDGNELFYLAYEEGREVIASVSLRTGETQRWSLSGSEGVAIEWLSRSPDGRSFAYVASGGGTSTSSQLWLLSLESGEPVPLTGEGTREWSASWSPNSHELYFISNRGGARDLWIQEITEGGRPRREARPVTAGMSFRNVALSPDGRKLAYSQGTPIANLWRVPVTLSREATWADAEQLTFDQALIEFIDVTPDGRQVVLDSDRTGAQQLWLLSVEERRLSQLTDDASFASTPRWAPNTKDVVFHSSRSGNRDVWVMSTESGSQEQVTENPGNWDGWASLSPDGQEVAFTSLRSGNFDVWVGGAHPGEFRQLSQSPAMDWGPDWSPDGAWIIFHSDRGGRFRMWRVPSEGGVAEPVSDRAAQFGRWSRDGSEVYIIAQDGPRRSLWAVSLRDGSERPLADLAGRPGILGAYALATDGRYVYFAWQEDLSDIWVVDIATSANE